jgi:hypothetical protein
MTKENEYEAVGLKAWEIEKAVDQKMCDSYSAWRKMDAARDFEC